MRRLTLCFFVITMLLLLLVTSSTYAQTASDLEHVIVLNVRTVFDQWTSPSPINFTFEANMGASYPTRGSAFTRFVFSWRLDHSSNSTMMQTFDVPYTESYREYFVLVGLYTNSCLNLGPLTSVVGSMSGTRWSTPMRWDVKIDGDVYRYTTRQLVSFSPSQSSVARALQSQLALSSSMICVLQKDSPEQRIIGINLTLWVRQAKKCELDLSPLEKLSSGIRFDQSDDAHIVIDSGSNPRLLIVRSGITDLLLSGSYVQRVPDLLLNRTVSIPFSLRLNLSNGYTTAIGPQLREEISTWAAKTINNDMTLLNETRILLPETASRFEQATADLSDLGIDGSQFQTSSEFFPLDRALKLISQGHEEIMELIFSSGILVAPAISVIVFIVGAIISHFLFNGSKKVTIILFIVIATLMFEVHSGLRLLRFSVPTISVEALTDPSVRSYASLLALSSGTSFVFLLLTAIAILRYSGTASIYSLSFSNAVRLIKSRKLRGLLTMVTVMVIAMAIVPSLTLKMVFPIVSEITISEPASQTLVCFSNVWSSKLIVRTPSGDIFEESAGFIPMSYDEAIFNAGKLGLRVYTPVYLSVYTSPGLIGSVIFANLTLLSRYCGLKLQRSPSIENKTGIVFINELLIPSDQPMPASLTVEGARLVTAGSFVSPGLTLPNGIGFEEYLKEMELFIGVPDWDSLTSFPDPMSILVAQKDLSGNQRFRIPTPILGVGEVDVSMYPYLRDRVILLVGEHVEQDPSSEVEDYLRSLISSGRIWLSTTRQIGAIPMTLSYISSYSAMIKRGSESTTLQMGFPTSMIFGTWYAQIILMSIGTLIVLSVVLNSTYERRQESMIMSSLGASPKFITYSFVAEGLMLGIIGACTGYIMGYAWGYWIGVGSPEIASELHSLTPLLLVLVASLVVTGVGSAFPAREAILRVVPSKVMLSKDIGEINVEKDGSRRVLIPIRLRKEQLARFSASVSDLDRYYSSTHYGVNISSHERQADGEALFVNYRGFIGYSERVVAYHVKIRYNPVGEFYQVDLVMNGPEEKWTRDQQDLIRQMVYDLRDELLRITLSRYWESGK